MAQCTVILCEGAHDQATLTALCEVCAEWSFRKYVPRELPDAINAIYPRPHIDDWGAARFESPPSCLSKGDDWLVVRQLGGLEQVLGPDALALLGQVRVEALGVIVDADESKPKSRLQSFVKHYSSLYEHARRVKLGQVLLDGAKPRLGFWVCPDNNHEGTMAHLVVEQSQRAKSPLHSAARDFVESAARVEGSLSNKQGVKAVLGTMHQVLSPGASLASGLRRSKGWIQNRSELTAQFAGLLGFIDELTEYSAERD